ncbi:hypothetical protein SCHPADRAFT_889173 [Schizopora paradoxa]|uniref:Uncharacterized protein n=1 Tax=Schizopora paradoxa TaxID=27342 RepID=A0A0H2RYF1_9AGAM|nr:hypothetical protein SCHPADRAFT_889173 [Schizopora paradoxa]
MAARSQMLEGDVGDAFQAYMRQRRRDGDGDGGGGPSTSTQTAPATSQAGQAAGASSSNRSTQAGGSHTQANGSGQSGASLMFPANFRRANASEVTLPPGGASFARAGDAPPSPPSPHPPPSNSQPSSTQLASPCPRHATDPSENAEAGPSSHRLSFSTWGINRRIGGLLDDDEVLRWAEAFDEEERERQGPPHPSSPTPSDLARIDDYLDELAFDFYIEEQFFERYGYNDIEVYERVATRLWYAPHVNNPAFDAYCAELEFQELVDWCIAFEDEDARLEQQRKEVREGLFIVRLHVYSSIILVFFGMILDRNRHAHTAAKRNTSISSVNYSMARIKLSIWLNWS